MTKDSKSPPVTIDVVTIIAILILTAVFSLLKLVGYINWSWWWVLSPLLIAVSLFLLVLIGGSIIAFIAGWRLAGK